MKYKVSAVRQVRSQAVSDRFLTLCEYSFHRGPDFIVSVQFQVGVAKDRMMFSVLLNICRLPTST